MEAPRVEALPERRVVVARHVHGLDQLDVTRRPMYQELIMHEAVGGPSMLRFRPDDPEGERYVDVLVAAAPGFPGRPEFPIETLPAGRFVVADYEGPEEGLAEARRRLRAEAEAAGHETGVLLQVHMMDPIDGITEQELQLELR